MNILGRPRSFIHVHESRFGIHDETAMRRLWGNQGGSRSDSVEMLCLRVEGYELNKKIFFSLKILLPLTPTETGCAN